MARYDFVVLGSGPAGRRAAVQAAKLGKSVLVIDNRARVGGVSVHTGTIPSKTLRETVGKAVYRETVFLLNRLIAATSPRRPRAASG